MHKLTTTLLMTLFLTGMPPAAGAADQYYPTYLIIRYLADGSRDKQQGAVAEHRTHLAANGRIVALFRVLDDDGKPIGVGSWSAFDSEDDAQSFVKRDPYYKAGLYKGVSIAKTDLYLLDKWFSLVPEWHAEVGLRGNHRAYRRLIRKKTVAPR